MPVAPFAVRKLIPPGSNDPRIVATQVILHVAVSEGSSLYDFFRSRSGGIESHFYIRRDGVVEQYRDTDYEADANYTANQRAISVETQGMGDGEWTPQQLDSIKRLLMWAHDQHGIPLRPCPAHDLPGVGYHVMFGAPGPWTPVAKSCPGPDRVRQFQNVLVPWMSGAPSSPEDDMPFTDWPQKDRDALAQAVAAEVARIPVNVIGEKDRTVALKFAQARTLHAARTAAAAINADAIAAAVVAALPAGDINEATVAAGVKRALTELLEEK